MGADLAGLAAQARRLDGTSLSTLNREDPARARDFALRLGPLYASFARQSYDHQALDGLFALADAADLTGAMHRLVDGEQVNATEGRAALHTALRGDLSPSQVARAAHAQALDARAGMRAMIDALAASDVTDIV